jgi:hypothetical protein
LKQFHFKQNPQSQQHFPFSNQQLTQMSGDRTYCWLKCQETEATAAATLRICYWAGEWSALQRSSLSLSLSVQLLTFQQSVLAPWLLLLLKCVSFSPFQFLDFFEVWTSSSTIFLCLLCPGITYPSCNLEWKCACSVQESHTQVAFLNGRVPAGSRNHIPKLQFWMEIK